MSEAQIHQLQHAIGELRQCVGGLRSRYGNSTEVRRLVNDVERLDIDAAELAGPPAQRAVSEQEKVRITDTPYDPTLWRDADDEGVGGYQAYQS
ncbi:MAG: hypothetical protein ACRDRL_21440 [Sciscionella sp.]